VCTSEKIVMMVRPVQRMNAIQELVFAVILDAELVEMSGGVVDSSFF